MSNREQRRAKAENRKVILKVDGAEFPFDLMGTTSKDRLELFHQSKLTLNVIVEALDSGAVDTFFIAGLVFLARRQMGQPAKFDTIAEGITFESEIDLVIVDESEVDEDAPKATEASSSG